MTDVFISYAREDRGFVQRLHDALSNDGHGAWVDWEGIPASAKWMAEVRAAIDEADCFCFVVSPDSVESPVCREEAAHAAASNKRILPLLHRKVDDGLVPETVAAHNWIEFEDEQNFDAAFATLVRALQTEPEHLRTHTRLLVRAKEWEGAGRVRSSLLRGQDLVQAESWLGASQGKEPTPTQLHTAYVLASRKAASRRQRTTIGAVALALVISLVLSAVALVQRSRAEDQTAVAERLLVRARAALAMSTDPVTAVILAAVEARTRQDLAASDLVTVTQDTAQQLTSVAAAVVAPTFDVSQDGTRLAAIGDAGRFGLWDLTSGDRLATRSGISAVAFGGSGGTLALGRLDGTVTLVDPPTGEELRTIATEFGPVVEVSFDATGRYLAVGSAGRQTGGISGTILDLDSASSESVFDFGDSPTYRVVFERAPLRVITADVGTGAWLVQHRLNDDSTQSSVISPNGPILAVAFDAGTDLVAVADAKGVGVYETTHLGETAARHQVARLASSSGRAVTLAWAPGRGLLAVGTIGGRLLILDPSPQQVVWSRSVSAPVIDVAFGIDGTKIIAALADGTVHVMTAGDGTDAAVLRPEGVTVMTGCSLPAGGSHAIGQAFDGRVFVWQADSHRLERVLEP